MAEAREDGTGDPTQTSAAEQEVRRRERRALVGALAGELGHDLQTPLNLLRLTVERIASGERIERDDLELAREELGRLTSLSARLRALARAALTRTFASPAELVSCALSRGSLVGAAGLELELLEGPRLHCDVELVALALRELIDNALFARRASAGVRFNLDPVPAFCVWDDGEGFSLAPAEAFAWGVTSKPDAAGLGLTVAARVARAHGFKLEQARTTTHTELWLRLPSSALAPEAVRATA